MSSQRRPVANFVRKEQIVPGVGVVAIMADARRIVVEPTTHYQASARLIETIFAVKTRKKPEHYADYPIPNQLKKRKK